MAYNPRMSIIPASQQQGRGKAGKREKEETDLMILRDAEIVGCIRDLGFPKFDFADLEKPNPLQVQMIFEVFAEKTMNVTRETVDPAMRAAADGVCGEDLGEALMPSDTRNLMGFYAAFRQLLVACGVPDFSFSDMYKPTHRRLVHLLSYLINFVRFRQGHAELFVEHYDRVNDAKARIDELYAENQDMDARMDGLRRNRRNMEALAQEKTRRNEDLKRRLLELRRNQERVAARLEDAKAKKTELAGRLEARTADRLALKQESAKLRPYTLQSPSALQASLADLSATLNAERAHIDSLDRRARALQTSSDSFTVVCADVTSCIKLLEEVGAELGKEDEETARKSRQRDALAERGAGVKAIEREESMLQRQLAKWNERTDRLREQSAQRAHEAKEKMESLKAVHKRLNEERTEKGRDMERRRVRIEQTEKKMQDLKENIEREVHDAHDEYLKLEAHMKLYMTEMEQAF
ncbi:kinetochore protein nuf-2 [Gaeumannomyces tritici R3-111a-1]|uniref:Probable kinetochore protein NUF2 n=1 Tax=Gaeumannomyces tritici (strain R3-111a-1) TaxID=644352 RepID=J3P5H3_GAET3|nr:kinetochore protein nuf-2 [Gaeumannomyces tritici R3-111a-1]EJT74924.1 kinetochore protein nuf-2 [Gaeumannomyces tritici R3-111a-1]